MPHSPENSRSPTPLGWLDERGIGVLGPHNLIGRRNSSSGSWQWGTRPGSPRHLHELDIAPEGWPEGRSQKRSSPKQLGLYGFGSREAGAEELLSWFKIEGSVAHCYECHLTSLSSGPSPATGVSHSAY